MVGESAWAEKWVHYRIDFHLEGCLRLCLDNEIDSRGSVCERSGRVCRLVEVVRAVAGAVEVSVASCAR